MALKYPICYPSQISDLALRYNNIVRCRQTSPEDPIRQVVIIGDSHAEHLFWGLAKKMPKGKNLMYFSASSLPLIVGEDVGHNQRMAHIINILLKDKNLETIILAGYWSRSIIDTDTAKSHLALFEQTVGIINSAGKRIIIAQDVPDLDFDPKDCMLSSPLLINSDRFRSERDCGISRESVNLRQKYSREVIDEILKRFPYVQAWDPVKELCTNDWCAAMKNRRMIYRDANHLTLYASELVAESLSLQ